MSKVFVILTWDDYDDWGPLFRLEDDGLFTSGKPYPAFTTKKACEKYMIENGISGRPYALELITT